MRAALTGFFRSRPQCCRCKSRVGGLARIDHESHACRAGFVRAPVGQAFGAMTLCRSGRRVRGRSSVSWHRAAHAMSRLTAEGVLAMTSEAPVKYAMTETAPALRALPCGLTPSRAAGAEVGWAGVGYCSPVRR
jgi:hypothetical protein